MSFNVLIIPEDFIKDQYMLKPIITAMMQEIGKPKAKVKVCTNPRFHGISHVLDWKLLKGVIDKYHGMVNLFLLLVDRDGERGRRIALNNREEKANKLLPDDRVFLAENAWQEIEIWVLAGHDLPPEWNWKEIREERDSKEAYYIPYAESRNLLTKLGEGRKILAEEAATRYNRIRQKCDEIAKLENRVNTWLT